MKKLKKYPAYKDSGIEWIGEIPEHWEVRKLKHVSIFKNGYAFNSNYYSDIGTPIMRIGDIKVNFNLDKCPKYPNEKSKKLNEFIISKGSVLLALTGATIGKSIIYDKVDKAYLNQRVGMLEAIENITTPIYLFYIFQTSFFRNYIIIMCDGGAQENIGKSEVGNYKFPLPPLSEQKEIASFLDKKTAEIDKAIELKQKENELLKERRQVAINLAVTRGLHPNVRLKDSGIEWIGEIPEHWEVRKLKHVYMGFSNGTSAYQVSQGKSEYPVTRIETISLGEINYDKVGFIRKIDALKKYKLIKGDILISNINSFEKVGNTALYKGERELYHGMNLLRISPRNRVNTNYYHSILKTNIFLHPIRLNCKPAINQVSVPSSKIKNICVPLPPLSEQKEIAKYLEELESKTNRLLELNNQAIAKLKEYKQVLIDQAVRGQICLV